MEVEGLPSPSRLVGALVLAGALFVAVVTARLVNDGRESLEEAFRLKRSGDRPAAVAAFEDTAKAYVPGSPYPARAIRELTIMAKGAEMRGDPVEGAAILEAARRSILATRHFVQPHLEELVEVERELARVRRSPEGDLAAAGRGMERPADPSAAASMLLFVGLVSWIGGSLAVCLVGPSRGARGRRVRRYGWLASLVGFALWVVMSAIAG